MIFLSPPKKIKCQPRIGCFILLPETQVNLNLGEVALLKLNRQKSSLPLKGKGKTEETFNCTYVRRMNKKL